MPRTVLVELRNVSKSFGSTRALRDVCLEIYEGEVHALAGENGAGKSTLIRILSGVHGDFEGELLIHGRRTRFFNPIEAARSGIAAIHQELSLIGPMSVADNLLLGNDEGRLFGVLAERRRRDRVQAMLRETGLEVDPDVPVEELPLATRQLLEIEKALARNARIVIMDEPTSALSDVEADRLLSRTERLRKQGCAVLYISHRMEEIHRVADRVSVLRDGARVATERVDALKPGDLMRWMLGRSLETRERRAPTVGGGAPMLQVSGLTVRDPRRAGRHCLSGVSFDAKPGEIIGIAGVRGAGTSELLHAMFGALGPVLAGDIRIAGSLHEPISPARSIEAGVVLLANDRSESVMGNLSIRENASLSVLSSLSPFGWIHRNRETEAVRDVAARVRIRAPSVETLVEHLSGGNQQKTALARCVLARPRVLLLDEPTRGIDIGAKADIYDLIRDLAGKGAVVLLVASELEELLLLCDRVLVLARGRLVANFGGSDLTRERIVEASVSRSGAAESAGAPQ